MVTVYDLKFLQVQTFLSFTNTTFLLVNVLANEVISNLIQVNILMIIFYDTHTVC